MIDPPELAAFAFAFDDGGGGVAVAVGGLAVLVVPEEAEEGVICSFLRARFCAEVMDRVVVACALRNLVAAVRNMVALVAAEEEDGNNGLR